MKTITKPFGRYLVLILATLLAVSCGSDKSEEAAFLAKKRGQTETLNNEATHTPSMNETAQPLPLEEAPVVQPVASYSPTIPGPSSLPLTVQNVGTNFSTSTPQNDKTPFDVPAANTQLGLGNFSQGFNTTMPYYCDITRYPAHIVNAIAACKPFWSPISNGPIPWTDLNRHGRDDYGYGRYGRGRGLLDRYDEYDDGRDFRDGLERRNGREERAWKRVHRKDRHNSYDRYDRY